MLPPPQWTPPKLAVAKPLNLVGLVIGTQNMKTAKVRVARHLVHPVVKKIITRHTNYLCHDEHNACVLGDIVRIESCGQLSRRKSFAVAEVLKGGQRYAGPGAGPSDYHMNKGAPPGLEARVKELVAEGRSYIAPKARVWRDQGKKSFGDAVPEQCAQAPNDGREVPEGAARP